MYVYRYLNNQECEPMRAELLLVAFIFNLVARSHSARWMGGPDLQQQCFETLF